MVAVSFVLIADAELIPHNTLSEHASHCLKSVTIGVDGSSAFGVPALAGQGLANLDKCVGFCERDRLNPELQTSDRKDLVNGLGLGVVGQHGHSA